ncbi:hypothetical protein V2J09_020927 [Rumex salicifolius]
MLSMKTLSNSPPTPPSPTPSFVPETQDLDDPMFTAPSSPRPESPDTIAQETVHPPREPPDRLVWWSEIVSGGAPKEPTIINEEFLKDRIKVSFPDGEDGDPSITIALEVLDALSSVWRPMDYLWEMHGGQKLDTGVLLVPTSDDHPHLD